MYFVYSIPYTYKRDCTAPKPRQGRENQQNLPVLLAFSRSSGYSVYRPACCGTKRRGHREMTAFTPVDPANPQRETIYTQLKNAIINGDIAPDERIVETKYADIFRVSRTPVREAIRMLEREGLVVYEPRKGAVARPRLTRAEVDEVYTIRSALQLLSVDAVVRNITDAQLEDYLHRHSGRTGDGSEFFKIGAFKLLPDGSLGGKTAALREPYEGDPENKGIFVYDEKVFYDLLEKAYRNGLQLAIHAIGDYTMDVILDCYERIAAKYPKPDPRFRIIHCQITSEDILDRFARNGVLADIQPLFIRADMEIAEELLGKERVSTSYAWKTMLNKGIHVSGSSDAPVESFDPILAIHCAVTSQNLDGQPAGGWLPQQKLTVQEAVALYTTGSAYTSYEENVKGKLCPGYLADFIVLSQDIFSVPENEIVNTKVEQTYLGGKLVYSR